MLQLLSIMVKVVVKDSRWTQEVKYEFTPSDADDLYRVVNLSRHFCDGGSLEDDGVGVGRGHVLQEGMELTWYPPTGVCHALRPCGGAHNGA